MPVTVQWENESHTLIRYVYSGAWTWEEMYAAVEQVNAMLDTVDYKVFFITDMAGVTKNPPGMISHIRNAMQLRHPNSGSTVVITQNTFLVALYNILSSVLNSLRDDFRLVHTHEEAEAVIAEWQSQAGV